MKLFTREQRYQLIINGKPENRNKDRPPVVKLFLPGTACTWLLSEIDYEDEDIAFGLCDLGFGTPELGSVDLKEIAGVTNPYGLNVERDRYFTGAFPLSVYVSGARTEGRIIEDPDLLRHLV